MFENYLKYYSIARAPEGAGGGTADPPAAGGSPPPGGTQEKPAAGGKDAGNPPAGEKGSASAAPEGPYRPEGLPETIFGKDDRETIDKLAAALNGYRQKDSKRDVPKDVKEYATFENIDEKLKPFVEGFKDDPVFAKISETALASEVPKGALQNMVTALLKGYQEAGILEEPIDPKVERAALLPDAAKTLPQAEQDKAIDKRMNDNFAYLRSLENRGGADKGLGKKEAEYLITMLGDSAYGHRAIEFFRSQIERADEARPAGGGAGNSAQNERAALKAELAKPENQAGHPKFNQESYDALLARYKKVVGE